MKALLLNLKIVLIIFTIFSSCRSEESIEKEIFELKHEIAILKNSSEINDYKQAVEVLESAKQREIDLITVLKKIGDEKDKEELKNQINHAQKRIQISQERLENYKKEYDEVQAKIKNIENKISALRKK